MQNICHKLWGKWRELDSCALVIHRNLACEWNEIPLTVSPSRPHRAAGVDHQSRVENAEEVGRLGAVPVQLPVEAVLCRRRFGALLGG